MTRNDVLQTLSEFERSKGDQFGIIRIGLFGNIAQGIGAGLVHLQCPAHSELVRPQLNDLLHYRLLVPVHTLESLFWDLYCDDFSHIVCPPLPKPHGRGTLPCRGLQPSLIQWR